MCQNVFIHLPRREVWIQACSFHYSYYGISKSMTNHMYFIFLTKSNINNQVKIADFDDRMENASAI